MQEVSYLEKQQVILATVTYSCKEQVSLKREVN